MSEHLLSLAIGPVQDFIAAARRTRDLWFGSHLLSEVCKAAAASLARDGATMIFPHDGGDFIPESSLTVANKLLAILDSSVAAKAADNAEKAARQRLRDIAAAAHTEAEKFIEVRDSFDRQIEGILEVYAVWAPYDAAQYPKCRRRLEELAAARKALRNFSPYQGESGVFKSSLDGVRENVIESILPNTFESTIKRLPGDPEGKVPGERLDAIGVVKRVGSAPNLDEFPRRFESTIDVAGVGFGQRAKREYPDEFAQYERIVRRKRGRGHYGLLYEHESRQVNDLTQEEKSELDLLRKVFGRPVAPYYALLVGDGDGVGKLISEGIHDPGGHAGFSRALAAFAAEAHKIIHDSDGCPVYTGGDDVMALLPLHTALECALEIRHAFGEALKEFGQPTFSAGLAVAHALEPLSEVLRIARRAEGDEAKKMSGKNAVAITVVPRSGADVSACGHWDEFVPEISRIAKLMRDAQLSPGLAYELRSLDLRTPVDRDGILGKLARAVAEKKQSKKEALRLVDRVENRQQLQELYGTMLVARPFYRAKKEADGA